MAKDIGKPDKYQTKTEHDKTQSKYERLPICCSTMCYAIAKSETISKVKRRSYFGQGRDIISLFLSLFREKRTTVTYQKRTRYDS